MGGKEKLMDDLCWKEDTWNNPCCFGAVSLESARQLMSIDDNDDNDDNDDDDDDDDDDTTMVIKITGPSLPTHLV